ncbi:beta strand repeat-containing protein [Dokdonella sp. MW10]|uniref:beta strand repeat-containing protein n=1 Tax=Dokdonella sp. MW10 TaxID=2992926 RepID=UPI003F7E1A5C
MSSRWIVRALSALLVAASLPAIAQTYTYSVYVDTDANPATGCVEAPAGGGEVRLDVVVAGGSSPQVTSMTRHRCSGGAFGAGIPLGAGYPVGVGNGIAGTDTVEIADALGELQVGTAARFTVAVVARSASGSDDLLAGADGGPIVVGLPAIAIPTLAWPAVLLLATLMAFAGARRARRLKAAWRLVGLVLLGSSGALAANFVVDGLTGDWNGVGPLAVDAAGDATSGEAGIDLRAFFAAIENGRVFMRIDVTNTRNTPPTATPTAATTLEDTAVTLTLSGVDPEGDALVFAIATPPTQGTLGPVTSTSPSTATVTYTPNADRNGSDSFTFTAGDGQGTSIPATAAVAITPVNDAPEFTPQDPPAVDEGSGPQTATVATGIRPGPVTATDESGQVLTFAITANGNPTLFDGTPTISPAGVLSWAPAAGENGTAALTVVLRDDGGTANGGVDESAPQTITVTVNAVDDPPVVTAGGTLAWTEGDAPAILDAGVTVTDPDSTDLVGATVQIMTNLQSGADVLSFVNTPTITGVYTPTTGALVLSGTDTIANYQAALRNVRFENTSQDPSTAVRTVTWIARDAGGDSAPATGTITITAVNDAPVLTAGATLAYEEGDAATPVDTTVTVTDPDNTTLTGASVQLTANYVNGEDVLAFANTATITATFTAGTGTLVLSGNDTLANYQAALRAVTYANTSGNPSALPRTVTWTATDGVATSVPVTSTITVGAVNDAPVIGAGGTLLYTEGDAPSALDPLLTVSDVDSANLAGATVRISANHDDSQDFLAFANTATITATYAAATGTLTLTGTDTVANYQAALRTVTYANTSQDPSTLQRTITWTASDDAGATSQPAASTVAITAVNDAPVVTALGNVDYLEGSAPVVAAPFLTVGDVDDANLEGATVQIAAGLVVAEDVLAFTAGNGITGSYTAASGTLVLTGTSSVANYQAALRSVTYVNTIALPTTAPRTLSWTATDGDLASAPATTTVTVQRLNEAPVVTAGGTLAYTEGSAATVIDAAVTVSDPDDTDLAGASVQIAAGFATGQDVLAATPAGGITASFNPATGVLTLTGTASLAAYQAALRSVTYANTSTNPSTTPRSIAWTVTDGEATSATATSTITITPVNDPPVLTAGGTLAYEEGDPPTPVDATITVADPDNTTLAGASVQVTGNYVNGEDVLAFANTATITATFDAGSGTMALTGTDTLGNYQAALRAVTYANTSGDPSASARTITWVANDGAATSVPVTSTVTVAAVNDAPVVTAGGTLAFTEGDAATPVDPSLTVTDVDSTNLSGATVQITTNRVEGEDVLAFVNTATITATFVPATGTLTLAGTDTVANYQLALRAVTYANTSDDPSTLPRTVAWTATDAGGATSTPASSTITVAAVNDAPVVTAAGNVDYLEGSAPVAVAPALTVTDPDDADLEGATVQIAAGLVAAEDVLAFTPGNGITGSYTAATGTLVLTGTSSVANYQAALRSVTYVNTIAQPTTAPRTLAWSATDGDLASAAATTTVTVQRLNEAPVVMAGGTLAYTEGSGAVAIAPGLTVTDADDTQLAGATVQITAGYTNGQDVLGGGSGGGVTASFNAGTGTLTLTGTASVAAYQAALRSVTYTNTSSNPSTAPRTVAWVASDGEAASATATSTITITPVNDAPVVTPPAALPVHSHIAIDVAAGATGYLLAPGSISDPDSSTFVVGGSIPTTTTQGGRVTITAATGAYTYDPPAGVSSGTDSFSYQVCDDGVPVACSAPATMTFTLSGPRVWFVDPAATPGGTGTLQRPLQTFATAAGLANANTDRIFLYSGTHTGGATLSAGVWVIGHSVTGAGFDAEFGLFPPSNSVARPAIGQARPVITTTTGTTPGITLGNGNTLRALEIGNTTGPSISGNGFGMLNVRDGVLISGSGQALALSNGSFVAGSIFEGVSSSSGNGNIALTNVSGEVNFGNGALSASAAGSPAVLVSGGSLTAIYSGSVGKTTNGHLFDIGTRTSGALTFSGNLSSSGVGSGVRANANSGGTITFSGASKTFASTTANAVDLTTNTGSTIAFTNGGLVLSTTTGAGFQATGGGTISVEGSGNTISSGSGIALNVLNTTIGFGNATFQSVSSNGASSGIVLNATGTSGRLAVTGTGGAGSGGTIQNAGTHGIQLTGTSNPSFTSMRVLGTAGSGVKGTLVNGFTFANGAIDASGTGGAPGESNIAFNTAVTGTEVNLTGAVAITNNALTNARYHGVHIANYAGSISNLQVSGNTFTSSTSNLQSLGSGILVVANGSAGGAATVNAAAITNNVITNFPGGSGIRVQGGNAAGATQATLGIPHDGGNLIAITGNQVRGESAANRINLEGILFAIGDRGRGNVNISGNGTAGTPIANITGSAISVSALNAGAEVTGSITNNVVAPAHPANSLGANGIAFGVNGVNATDNPTMSINVSNNIVSQTDGNGILGVVRATQGVLNARVENNTVAAPLGGVRPGIRLDSGNNAVGENTTLCVALSGNTSAGSGGTEGIGLRKQGAVATTDAFGIVGLGVNTTSPLLQAYVNGQNPAGGGTLLISATSGFRDCTL